MIVATPDGEESEDGDALYVCLPWPLEAVLMLLALPVQLMLVVPTVMTLPAYHADLGSVTAALCNIVIVSRLRSLGLMLRPVPCPVT
jgi:hypothetical protein